VSRRPWSLVVFQEEVFLQEFGCWDFGGPWLANVLSGDEVNVTKSRNWMIVLKRHQKEGEKDM
jgi:hypothetical protein